MKQFNYDLLENKRDQLEQDNSGENRVYHSPNGTYPSVTNVLYQILNKENIEAWRDKIGHEEADKITHRAARRGTNVHGILEKYLQGDVDFMKGVMPEHKELVLAGLSQIDERIDNIRGIELSMWSDDLKLAGTSDLIADYNGELAVIDWKTAAYLKKEEWLLSYILQGTAYSRMLYEMYGLIPKKVVVCSFIRFDSKKYNHMMDQDIFVDWKEYNPLDYIRQLKSVCDAFHFKMEE